ncbi:DNA polymerase ligase-domain-containing protein [Phyllosticta citribraziliensis]
MSTAPCSLKRSISPPTPRRKRARLDEPPSRAQNTHQANASAASNSNPPSLAAIEAGEAKIDDHLTCFSTRLAAVSRCEPSWPRLSIDKFGELYRRNDSPRGCHFVVHQHDHPVSGPHYDLRLQFSQSSSVSFALPYGLPGNPHSKRPTRMALETRVHCLWNHLIETASNATGSLIIWDTGEYEVLDRKSPTAGDETDSSTSSDGPEIVRVEANPQHQNVRLIEAFQNSRITLRLHGTRLPPNYTINMWLPSANRAPRAKSSSETRPIRRRRSKYISRHHSSTHASAPAPLPPSTDSDPDPSDSDSQADQENAKENKSADDVDDEAAAIRATNAYTGATNSIGSVHSRQWFVSMNKQLCGTASHLASRDRRDDGRENATATFLVCGPAVERSVVTGRLAADVVADEGVVGFVPRSGWRAIVD